MFDLSGGVALGFAQGVDGAFANAGIGGGGVAGFDTKTDAQ